MRNERERKQAKVHQSIRENVKGGRRMEMKRYFFIYWPLTLTFSLPLILLLPFHQIDNRSKENRAIAWRQMANGQRAAEKSAGESVWDTERRSKAAASVPHVDQESMLRFFTFSIPNVQSLFSSFLSSEWMARGANKKKAHFRTHADVQTRGQTESREQGHTF
jgi:hypothetical protein